MLCAFNNTHHFNNTPTEQSQPLLQALYDDAMRAYHEACGCSSAHLGDDLPSLLHNWACGLLSKAQHLAGGDDGLLHDALVAILQDAVTVRAWVVEHHLFNVP